MQNTEQENVPNKSKLASKFAVNRCSWTKERFLKVIPKPSIINDRFTHLFICPEITALLWSRLAGLIALGAVVKHLSSAELGVHVDRNKDPDSQ